MWQPCTHGCQHSVTRSQNRGFAVGPPFQCSWNSGPSAARDTISPSDADQLGRSNVRILCILFHFQKTRPRICCLWSGPGAGAKKKRSGPRTSGVTTEESVGSYAEKPSKDTTRKFRKLSKGPKGISRTCGCHGQPTTSAACPLVVLL